jgi:hypothetical protein
MIAPDRRQSAPDAGCAAPDIPDRGAMDEVWGAPTPGAVRARLAFLASWADELAAETDAIGRVSGWETPAVAQFQAELAALSAALRGWSSRVLDFRAEIASPHPGLAPAGFPGVAFGPGAFG